MTAKPPAVPAPGADPVYEVCRYCGGDIAWIDGRWRAVQSRYPNEAHCHYSATAERRSIGHLPEAERGAS